MDKKKMAYKIVITGGGMCQGGVVADYMEKHLENKKALFLLTGYQAEGTNGYKLQEHSQKPQEEKASSTENIVLNLINGTKKIECSKIEAEIKSIQGYSGHADQKSLMEWYFTNDQKKEGKERSQKTLFLVHGDDKSREQLKSKMKEYHSANNMNFRLNIEVPQKDEKKWFNTDTDKWEVEKSKEEIIAEKIVEKLSTKWSEIFDYDKLGRLITQNLTDKHHDKCFLP